MPINIIENSGSFLGDPTGKFVQVAASLSVNSLTINGVYSVNGTVDNLNQTFNLAAPTASTNYLSIQVQSNGTLQSLTGASAPALGAGNLIEVFSLMVPTNATSWENNDNLASGDATDEPVLD